MATVFKTTGDAVCAITQEPVENAGRYGRLQLQPVSKRVYRLEAILSRTTPVESESLLVGVGRCLFSPECLDYGTTLLDQPRVGEFDDAMLLQ